VDPLLNAADRISIRRHGTCTGQDSLHWCMVPDTILDRRGFMQEKHLAG
jgi:hypothetical protein